jgi:hypothetical protein
MFEMERKFKSNERDIPFQEWWVEVLRSPMVAINFPRDYVCHVAILWEPWGATCGCYDVFPPVVADEYLPHGYLYKLISKHIGASKGFCLRYRNRGWL